MATKMGFDGKLYYNATLITGSIPTSSWVEVTKAVDVKVSKKIDMADVSTRAGGGLKGYGVNMKDATLTFDLVFDHSDTAVDAIEAAWHAGTELAWAAMDGAIATTGSKGTIFNGLVSDFERNEPLKDKMSVSITVVPSALSYLQAYTK